MKTGIVAQTGQGVCSDLMQKSSLVTEHGRLRLMIHLTLLPLVRAICPFVAQGLDEPLSFQLNCRVFGI